ncbi:MAG: LytTR family transcriptional regulator [Proteobacteria bacterium]|nr:LytTR family transcriptional regulator [Pseudomonadota bacterium]
MIPDAKRSFDWRVPLIWAVMLAISVFAHAYVEMADNRVTLARAVALEVTSHSMVAAMLPAIYWLHRHRPISGGPVNLAIHVAALVPFSFLRTTGMTGLRLLWFVGILGERYSFPLTLDRLLYELSKDVVNYALLSGAVVAISYLLERADARAAQPAPTIVDPPSRPVAPEAVPPEAVRPERFAVRKRGGNEVVVDVADIDWIEASGNYAILHVGGETFEIRSSLTKLEGELDPKRFVRVHKSHLVNIARVAEVTPWVSGDWRIRLQDGAEVNLSRRYRQRFEALAPVRS